MCTFVIYIYNMTGRIVVAVRLPSTSYASLLTATVKRETFLAQVFL